MIRGTVVGIVVDNVDPDGMHRVKVEFPVDSDEGLQSSWARMLSPMAGKDRGLVMLPEIGTEVVLAFAYQTMSPYVLGAVYNGGDDKPEPYHNDDENDDKRAYWSRNDHMILFDDTAGAEKVELGAQATTRLDITSGVIWQSLDSSQKTITEYCDGDTEWEAIENISFKCTDFKLEASQTISMEAGQTGRFKSGQSTKIESGSTQKYEAGIVQINPSAPPPDPDPPLDLPEHKHPPTKPE